ncbi:indoleamine 2,3-dioxygenase 2 isoform X1 [Thamnophis elegans]|uniref:indoleamine 2,3-dioxygenase 2 isoform X1 n=1 Tax=Thamnophis elegans TaxID=35005 RepID=UPI0013781EE0|nr:indoleamine 2,3-dioxygenase 2 isoform X1 [Thamnophis elegans]
MENSTLSVKQKPAFTLKRFHISEDYGFLLPNPLKELPPFYSPWMEIAHRLVYLIESHQLRFQVNKMPLLSCQYLQGHRELYLAHLVLSFITMGYVWQEGEKEVPKILPRNLAIPFGEVSEMLSLPPILVHTDFVLVNWKKKNPQGRLEIENLEPIVTFPGGTSTVGFILVSLLTEKVAAPGLKAIAKAVNGLLQPDDQILAEALQEVTNTLQEMTKTLKKMHDYVDPSVFYGVTRIFFSGWKDNPALPEGLLYEGLCEQPLAYSGGSAAQSSTLHAFDELLGIQHQKESAAFLHRMRKYMPPHHQAFIEEIRSVPRLKDHVLSSGNQDLQTLYNKCVAALSELRTYHITMVTKYILIAAKKAKNNVSQTTSPPSFLEGVGTGGSRILKFLKSVRDTTKDAMIQL